MRDLITRMNMESGINRAAPVVEINQQELIELSTTGDSIVNDIISLESSLSAVENVLEAKEGLEEAGVVEETVLTSLVPVAVDSIAEVDESSAEEVSMEADDPKSFWAKVKAKAKEIWETLLEYLRRFRNWIKSFFSKTKVNAEVTEVLLAKEESSMEKAVREYDERAKERNATAEKLMIRVPYKPKYYQSGTSNETFSLDSYQHAAKFNRSSELADMMIEIGEDMASGIRSVEFLEDLEDSSRKNSRLIFEMKAKMAFGIQQCMLGFKGNDIKHPDYNKATERKNSFFIDPPDTGKEIIFRKGYESLLEFVKAIRLFNNNYIKLLKDFSKVDVSLNKIEKALEETARDPYVYDGRKARNVEKIDGVNRKATQEIKERAFKIVRANTIDLIQEFREMCSTQRTTSIQNAISLLREAKAIEKAKENQLKK